MSKCVINNAGGANGVMIQILNFFVGKGYTPTQACAIAGNISIESGGYNPNAKENGGKGEGIGLCQWSFSRKTALKNYTENMPGKWQNVGNQLQYLWYELEHDYSTVGSYFKNNKQNTLSHYTDYWCDYFEVPDPKKAHKDRRLEEAKKAAAVYNQMNKDECAVDISGSSSSVKSSGFDCSTDGDDTMGDLNITDDMTGVAETTTAQSNGNTETSNNTMDARPLFIGDSWADKIYHNHGYMKKNWGLLAKQGLSMSSVAKSLKKTLSNKYRRPKYIVVYCSDDTKLQKNTSSMFVSGSVDLVKNWCREILSAGNGIQFYFCENVMNSIYRAGKSDYYWTAASVLNRALKKLEDEGDSAMFRVIKIDSDTRIDLAMHHSLAIPSELRMTLNPSGFTKLGSYIRKEIQG
ncbi:MAG: hypothetical protein II453_21195 [Alphaproteobacteria bacterium]|nr:hypothetical protein [Alphaproteobacteria bacterium]